MLHQIIEICEENRYLCLERGFLSVCSGADHIASVPLDDIAVLLVSARSVTFSKHILTELSERGIVSVLCGNNYLPASVILPVTGHYQQTGILQLQISASAPLLKNIWKETVTAKLKNQAKALAACGNTEQAPFLQRIADTVKSGDSDNREGYGAKLYWQALFGNDFVRDRTLGGINTFLNYGYAVMRAAMARAIVAAGLHPALGIHHKNVLNPFCLADDLFEPYRPLVDCIVYGLVREKQEQLLLTPECKQTLTQCLWIQMQTSAGYSPAFQSMQYLVSSYVKALRNGKYEYQIPLWEGKYEEFSCAE